MFSHEHTFSDDNNLQWIMEKLKKAKITISVAHISQLKQKHLWNQSRGEKVRKREEENNNKTRKNTFDLQVITKAVNFVEQVLPSSSTSEMKTWL